MSFEPCINNSLHFWLFEPHFRLCHRQFLHEIFKKPIGTRLTFVFVGIVGIDQRTICDSLAMHLFNI